VATHPLSWTDTAPASLTGGAVSFGNFDGVHRGHLTLIAALKRRAARVNGPAVAVTFDPPPVALLNPAALKLPLTTIEDRAELLHAAGADQVMVLKVEASLLALSAGSFIEEVIQRQLAARAMVEGSNFRFGRGREGDGAMLAALKDRTNISFDEVTVDAVSSSRVRAALNSGDVAEACDLLGRRYSIQGTVVEGAQRGRTLGFPTANLDGVPTLVPLPGVYAVEAAVDGQRYRGAANVGPNPTFGDDARKIEIHLLDFSGDLYGYAMRVEFLKRLRDVQTFATVDALKAQVSADVAAARRVP